MNVFYKLLAKLPPDKVQHFLFGALFSVLGAAAVLCKRYPTALSLLLAPVAVALGVGLAKEALDYLANRKALAAGQPAPHGVELMDVVATTLGGAYVGAILAAGLMVAAHA